MCPGVDVCVSNIVATSVITMKPWLHFLHGPVDTLINSPMRATLKIVISI